MTHRERVDLIRAGVTGTGGNLGGFRISYGAFALALAELLGADASIYSIDLNDDGPREQEDAVDKSRAGQRLKTIKADFTLPLELPRLSGALVANALHFVRDAGATIGMLRGYLAPGAHLIVVEYGPGKPGPWVPHPLPWRD